MRFSITSLTEKYIHGHSVLKISSETGVPEKTIKRVLGFCGIPLRSKKVALALRYYSSEEELLLTKEMVKEIYSKGYSERRTSELTGVPKSTVHKYLVEMGVPLRTKKDAGALRQNAPISDDYRNRRKVIDAVLLYKSQGFTQKEISSITGVPVSTVARHIGRVYGKNTPTPAILIQLFPEVFGYE